jgi:hypothetical protein
MSSNLSRHYGRLSEKAAKLRQGNCPKFDIRSGKELTDEDKKTFENIRSSAGWEELSYKQDGKDQVIQFRMPSIVEVDPDAIQNCTTYI